MSIKLLLFNTVLLVIFISNIKIVQSFHILAVFPISAKTHFYVFEPFVKELANRGHNVTVISYFPQKEALNNYHDINLGQTSQAVTFSHPMSNSAFVIFITITLLQAFGGPLTCRVLLEDENVQSLLESRPKFDLVILEQFNSDCALVLAHKLNAPAIGITSHMLLPWHYARYGVPFNPSYVMFDLLKGGTKPTFVERIKRTLLYQYTKFIYEHVTLRLEDDVIREFIDDAPPLKEMIKGIKLVLVYQNFVLASSTIAPPNVIEIGGYHVAKSNPLPQDLRNFIEESEHGVIYISFGSILKDSTLPKDKMEAIINALAELPQRVVWKWNRRQLPGNPKNIYVSKWMPQNDILAHPNVRAFFSHCGQLGTTEAIHHGVPVVGMPIFGDQPANAAAIEESGLGVQISLELLSKDTLLEKLKTVLKPEFRQRVKQLSEVWHDRPIKALDNAIYWTEFAARYSNFTFRAQSADVPLYQYLCLDVFMILFLVFFINCIVIKYVIWAMVKLFFIQYNIFISSRIAKKVKEN